MRSTNKATPGNENDEDYVGNAFGMIGGSREEVVICDGEEVALLFFLVSLGNKSQAEPS